MRRIIGGGLSGLAAAVNFAKEGEKVEIHEKRENVGDQFHANYQVLLDSHGDAPSYLKEWGLKPKFTYKNVKTFLCCTQKREFTVSMKEALPLILRGGDNSLERGIKDEAESEGEKFQFKSKQKQLKVKFCCSY